MEVHHSCQECRQDGLVPISQVIAMLLAIICSLLSQCRGILGFLRNLNLVVKGDTQMIGEKNQPNAAHPVAQLLHRGKVADSIFTS